MTNPRRDACRIPGTNRLAAAVALMLVVVAAQFAPAQTFNILHSFNGLDGQQPYDGVTLDRGGNLYSLVMDEAGNFYGTTYCDGANSIGNVFKLTPSGNGWTYTSLHDFTGGSGGEIPFCSVALDTSGNIYGTTVTGGSQGDGTIWEITP